jgi:hypothetical protein
MNYNALALMGQNITDEEYAETFSIPKEFIGTPRINEFMLSRQMNKEIEYYESQNMTHSEAMKKAGENMRGAAKHIEELVKSDKG